MTAYRAGAARVSSTVTKPNPRPRKYATASERQAAYRARAPEVCFRAESKTVETLDRIAETLDQSRADLLLSMTKFALANHDWARFGLTHRPLPFGYGIADEQPATNPAPIWKRKRPKSLGKPVPLTPKQKAAAKARAAAAGRKYPNLVDNIAASRMENPTVKKPTPAQLAARAKFAEMARSGAFKRKAKRKSNPASNPGAYGVSWVSPMSGKPQSSTYTTKAAAIKDAKALYNEGAKNIRAWKWSDSVGAVDFNWRLPTAVKLKRNPTKKTVSEKISQLVREGYPQKQAVAVALSEERAGKVKRNPSAIKWKRITDEDGTVQTAMIDGAEVTIFKVPKGEAAVYEMPEWTKYIFEVSPDSAHINTQYPLDSITEGKDNARGFVAHAKQMKAGEGRKPNPATGSKKSGTKLNPATGSKKSRTKLNPTSSSRFKYVCIAPLEYSGAKYGIDERTPVTLKFTKTEPAANLVYACYELPNRLVQNDDFQNFAYHNKVIYMSLAELKMLLKGYMK